MACINMYNADQQGSSNMMSPRISFSSDFVIDSHGGSSIQAARREPPDPSAPDFEFSSPVNSASSRVGGRQDAMMMSADELFSKGRLLPMKEQYSAHMQKLTLRDELQADEEDLVAQSLSRPFKTPIRWKGLLGLRRGGSGGKKHDKGNGHGTSLAVVHEETNAKNSQEVRYDGGRQRET